MLSSLSLRKALGIQRELAVVVPKGGRGVENLADARLHVSHGLIRFVDKRVGVNIETVETDKDSYALGITLAEA